MNYPKYFCLALLLIGYGFLTNCSEEESPSSPNETKVVNIKTEEPFDIRAKTDPFEITTNTNIGSDEMVSINKLVSIVAHVAGKKIDIEHEPGPQGVRGRKSDNTLIAALIGWRPSKSLAEGIAITYPWIEQQLHEKNR